jgi:hypothetical protein
MSIDDRLGANVQGLQALTPELDVIRRRRGRRRSWRIAGATAAAVLVGAVAFYPRDDKGAIDLEPVIETKTPWRVTALEIEPVPYPEVNSSETPPAVTDPVEFAKHYEIQHVAPVGAGWIAFGDAQGLAVHRSDDGAHWDLAFHDSHIAWNADVDGMIETSRGLLAYGSTSFRSGEHQIALWRSIDDGMTWTQLTNDPVESTDTSEFTDALDIDGRVLLAGSVGGEQADNFVSTPGIWVLSPSDVPERLDLAIPNSSSSVWRFGEVGERLVAYGDSDTGLITWESNDGGRSWGSFQPSSLPAGPSWLMPKSVRGQIVALGYGGDIAIFDDGWQVVRNGVVSDEAGADEERWFGLEEFRGRTLSGGSRMDRADDNFCYDDIATCKQYRSVIHVSSDLIAWERLAMPSADPAVDEFERVVTSEQQILVLGDRVTREYRADDDEYRDTRIPTAWVWTAASADDRPDSEAEPTDTFDAPKHQLLSGWDLALEPGVTYRWAIPINGCGSGDVTVGDQRFATTEPWPDPPYPADWPVRHEGVSDAPTEHLYGTVRLVEADTLVDHDTIEIGIERGDEVEVVRTYEPASPSQVGCG